jgi:hypothetical protein
MAKMFEAWETSCLESTKINLIARVVDQWSRATIFLALSSWHENVLKVKGLERAVKNMMNRWNKMALAVPYATWCEHVSGKMRLALRAEKAMRRWSKFALSQALMTWKKACLLKQDKRGSRRPEHRQ